MDETLISHVVFLSLGSNLGNRQEHLQHAIKQIEWRIGDISAVSSMHETSPWGFKSQHNFLNMVIKIKTRLLPRQVLYITQAIEREMGRKQKSKESYIDRIIDIDLIIFDDLEMKTQELTLPHPLYKERAFVMKPLNELLSLDKTK